MRSDMAKVIVERPRHGLRQKCAKGYKKAWQRLAHEDWPKREGIYAHKGHTKHFNEHLGPLRRFLEKQVGRPWDKVFAEICQHIRVDSAVQCHVRDHVFDFVEIHVVEVDGIMCHGSGWKIGTPLHAGGRWKQFYVCPRTGLLRKLKARSTKSTQLPVEQVAIDEMHEYRLMDGHWYLVEYRPVTVDSTGARDIVSGERVHFPLGWINGRYFGQTIYAARRRQLNTREISRLKEQIANDRRFKSSRGY
jgi:hypothetical protein